MLRIHFTDADLARVQVARVFDPLWETVMALHRLVGPGRGATAFAAWRERARAALTESENARAARLLFGVAPAASYFPDFLTPPEGALGLSAALDVVRGTDAARVRDEVVRTVAVSPVKRGFGDWTRSLANGDRVRLDEVAGALRGVHGAIVQPDWTRVGSDVDADRGLRARALRDGGVGALLDSMRPTMVWEPPVLRAAYPREYDLHLAGRGLRLVPSYFCWRTPVALADPGLPPVLVYPVNRSEPRPKDQRCGAAHARALGRLLGCTRGRVLAVLEEAATTGEVARRLAVAPASASAHVRALREAQLVCSVRDGSTVLHTLTPLGRALLFGGLRN
ncbi:helix-turn-helix domain-containing protein [Streptomyces sp. NPDC057302]|uniref:ArsR/SmtB family transcription factor n=1 Tax=Streptomyces sp. NPDC057302 TaxID=3346094 RepID=UPI0036339897